jgi:hypothetical protein
VLYAYIEPARLRALGEVASAPTWLRCAQKRTGQRRTAHWLVGAPVRAAVAGCCERYIKGPGLQRRGSAGALLNKSPPPPAPLINPHRGNNPGMSPPRQARCIVLSSGGLSSGVFHFL